MGPVRHLDLGGLDTIDPVRRHDVAVTVRYHRTSLHLRRVAAGTGRVSTRLGAQTSWFEVVAGYRLLRRRTVRIDCLQRITIRAGRTRGCLDSRDDAAVGSTAGDVVSQRKDCRCP